MQPAGEYHVEFICFMNKHIGGTYNLSQGLQDQEKFRNFEKMRHIYDAR